MTKQILLIAIPWVLWKAANFVWPLGARGGPVRHWLDSARLTIPVAGKTIRALAVARFCRVLGLSYAAGIELPKAVEMAAAACGNVAIADKLKPTRAELRRGSSFFLESDSEMTLRKTAILLCVLLSLLVAWKIGTQVV